MRLFSRKPKVGVEEFCRQFYDSHVAPTIAAGVDARYGFLHELVASVTDDELEAANFDPFTFQREVAALHLELFGVAWLHALRRERYTLPQVVFTRSYLEGRGHPEIWDAMLPYNQTIARSGVEIVAGKRMRRGWAAGMTSFRVQLFDKWGQEGIDPECAARLANRMGTDVAWRKGITVRMLTDTLLDRIGMITLTAAGRDNLQPILRSLYAGAKESINSVNLEVSEAREHE